MSYQRILAAIDLSDGAEMVARHAHELAQQSGADLSLLHVVEYLPPIELGYDQLPGPGWSIDPTELFHEAESAFSRFAERVALGSVPRRVLTGSPKHEILRQSAEARIDLIVLGSHGRRGLGRLLGSTAHAVLSAAHCDVLAVRIPSPR